MCMQGWIFSSDEHQQLPSIKINGTCVSLVPPKIRPKHCVLGLYILGVMGKILLSEFNGNCIHVCERRILPNVYNSLENETFSNKRFAGYLNYSEASYLTAVLEFLGVIITIPFFSFKQT